MRREKDRYQHRSKIKFMTLIYHPKLAESKRIIYVIGGIVLIFMGLSMIKSKDKEVRMSKAKVNSSLIGRVFYTALNPTQPLLWTTAGLALLMMGNEIMGILGIITVILGHRFSDFVYYCFNYNSSA